MLKNCLPWHAANRATLQPARLQILPLVLLLTTFLLPAQLLSQTEPSALLEVQSTDKGFLLPRMTQAQRDAIQSPATGLMIFNTTSVCLETNFGSPATPFWRPMDCLGTISSLNCAGSTVTGGLIPGQTATGVFANVPYGGGNGGGHNGQTVTSTGITGLTATLVAGSFAYGNGILSYEISGTPSALGTANFALNIGGQTCIMSINISCGAYVGSGDWKPFLCHNLAAANTAADPFTPSWEIAGGYWQWGRKGPASSAWLNMNTENFAHGPTGPDAAEANEAAVTDWSQTGAPNGAWSNAGKTANDPCPAGYRVPTKEQWAGVLANNTQSSVGTWSSSPVNYSSASSFGPLLLLPASGNRSEMNGDLVDRGFYGAYWSSTEDVADNAWITLLPEINSSYPAGSFSLSRKLGLPVRCVADGNASAASLIGALDCAGSTVMGEFILNQAATGVSATVPYTGGNGGAHLGQIAYSTGLTGLTATLAPGNFTNGNGTLTYAITGTVTTSGIAQFALSIGGKSCTLQIPAGCGAYVAQGQWKAFMCHNLAAANTAADPSTPSWEIIGGYWQWGLKGPAPSVWLNTNTENFAHGPTDPGAGETNEAPVSGWSSTNASNGAWADASKTANDPCPAGFRVPTIGQLSGVLLNNPMSIIGVWTNSSTNYSSGRFFGPNLMLPAAGYRSSNDGQLLFRGSNGAYWSSTEDDSPGLAWNLGFYSGGANTDDNSRRQGRSLRCVAE
ncbi:MAG: hypothetical protein RI973_1749 [Bacteroidota bacterium]|jgi:uncharacterized protein (TIGR02145 family)